MCIRKEISELIALYSLEPELRDIYVEGTFDKHLIEWFLSENNISNVIVYPIDTVNVPEDILNQQGLNDGGGNRARLIALSSKLASEITKKCHAICIADRDHEDYLHIVQENAYLKLTDYTSLDLYLFKRHVLQKLITLVFGGFPLGLNDLEHELTEILKEIFIIRLSSIMLNWNMQWISFTKYVEIKTHFEFKKDKFVMAYLQKNDRWQQQKEFEEQQSQLRAQLKDDPRYSIRGHDLIELLHHAVKKLKKSRSFGDPTTFQGVLAGCLELQDISNENLFQCIINL